MAGVGALSLVLAVLLAALPTTGQASVVKMLSRGQVMVLHSASPVTLQCEFYMEGFNLFDNPILWTKSQRGEERKINIMGNILDPFVATGRFDVKFVQNKPRFRLLLSILDLALEDYGNYTCEVRGPGTTILATLTHLIYVRAPVRSIALTNDNLTITDLDIERTLEFTEDQPSQLRCVSLGGCPPPEMKVTLGQRDITSLFSLTHTAALNGLAGLRLIEQRTERWSDRFSVTASDDGKRLQCIVSVSGLGANMSTVKIRVNYAPIIKCDQTRASIGDKNVYIRCEVRSYPRMTALFWIIDVNGTTLSEGEVVNEFWTLVMDRSDGALETRLFLRRAKAESFRAYSLVAENNIGTTTHQVDIRRKYQRPDSAQSLQVIDTSRPNNRHRKDEEYNVVTSLHGYPGDTNMLSASTRAQPLVLLAHWLPLAVSVFTLRLANKVTCMTWA